MSDYVFCYIDKQLRTLQGCVRTVPATCSVLVYTVQVFVHHTHLGYIQIKVIKKRLWHYRAAQLAIVIHAAKGEIPAG